MHAVCMTLVLAASAYTARGCAARCWGPAEARRRGPFHPPPGGPLGARIACENSIARLMPRDLRTSTISYSLGDSSRCRFANAGERSHA
jgi:hypothetical protein